MDVSFPMRAIVPTLDAPVLAVFARAASPLTATEVFGRAGVGSLNGVRRVLARLTEQGIIDADRRAAAIYYQANREHVAWPAVEVLVGLRAALFERIRELLRSWESPPVHVSVFGSMARADGGPDSDVDLLVIRPDDIDADESPWGDQVDQLQIQVERWTGNRCQVVQFDWAEIAGRARRNDALVEGLLRDAMKLHGDRLQKLIPAARTRTHR